jgi:hypothetical protein
MVANAIEELTAAGMQPDDIRFEKFHPVGVSDNTADAALILSGEHE